MHEAPSRVPLTGACGLGLLPVRPAATVSLRPFYFVDKCKKAVELEAGLNQKTRSVESLSRSIPPGLFPVTQAHPLHARAQFLPWVCITTFRLSLAPDKEERSLYVWDGCSIPHSTHRRPHTWKNLQVRKGITGWGGCSEGILWKAEI